MKRCKKKWRGARNWAELTAIRLFTVKSSAETVAVSTDEYKSVIFQCTLKFKNMKRCATPTLTEDKIKQRFLTAYNDLMGNRSTVLADCELIRQTLCGTTALDAEMQQEQDEMAVVSELMQTHIKKNASVAQSQVSTHCKPDLLKIAITPLLNNTPHSKRKKKSGCEKVRKSALLSQR
ncbi:MAG: hypothetical protein WA125_10345 [Desulfosporosinus sp.]